MDIGTYLTFTHSDRLLCGQVVRLKKTADSPEDWKLEVRGRSGRSLILESYIEAGCMLWPNWEHCDLFINGGWDALADAGYVRTYHFDAASAREKDRKDRLARKPAMVREDRKYDASDWQRAISKLSHPRRRTPDQEEEV